MNIIKCDLCNKKTRPRIKKIDKEFQINSICRADLIEYIWEKKELELNNKQMKSIANKMGDYFMYDYWNHLIEVLNLFEIKRINT